MVDFIKIIHARGAELGHGVGVKEALEMVNPEKPYLTPPDLMTRELNGWEIFRHVKARTKRRSATFGRSWSWSRLSTTTERWRQTSRRLRAIC